MKRLLLCAVLVVGMAGPAVAGFETGNTLGYIGSAVP